MNLPYSAAPSVSCVVPTHGRPEFLAAALSSVLKQSYLPVEIVVVSDDEDVSASEAVVNAASDGADVPIRLVRRAHGEPGASGSRNLGAHQAQGELLAFLDDDDIWEPEHLASAVALLANRQVDAVVSPFYRFSTSGRSTTTTPSEALTARDAFVRSPGVTGSTLVIRADVFALLGGYDVALPVMNDIDLFLRFLLAGHEYAVAPEPTVGVRKHDSGQLTDNSPRRVAGGWAFLEKHRGAFATQDVSPRLHWQYRMLWRTRPKNPIVRLRALVGMLRYPAGVIAQDSPGPSRRIQTRADLRDFIEADALAQGAENLPIWRRRSKPTLRFLRALRVVEYHRRPGAPFATKPLLFLAQRRLRRLAVLTGISIPPGAFGKGLGLPHYGSIVVHSRARFGDWCCVQNNVNIGVYRGGVPRGGDFLYVAPGAVLYGDITIGSGAVIGANSVVNTDVEANTTFAGSPARLISRRDASLLHLDEVAARMTVQRSAHKK